MRSIAIALALAGCSSGEGTVETVSADEANALNDAAEMLNEAPPRFGAPQQGNSAAPKL